MEISATNLAALKYIAKHPGSWRYADIDRTPSLQWMMGMGLIRRVEFSGFYITDAGLAALSGDANAEREGDT